MVQIKPIDEVKRALKITPILRDRFIISEPEELMNVKIYSGSPKVELVTGLDVKTYMNSVGVKITVPANSTVELAWGHVPFNLDLFFHLSYWRQIPSGIVYSLGVAYFTENGEVQNITYFHSNLNGDDVFSSERFLITSDNWFGEIGFGLKLQNITSSDLTVLITHINIFVLPPDKRILFYLVNLRLNLTVTETSETTKYSFYLSLPAIKRFNTHKIYLSTYIASDGVNTITLNVYINGKKIGSGSTTSSSTTTILITPNLKNLLKFGYMEISYKAYVTGGSGKIIRISFIDYAESEDVIVQNGYSKMTFTGTANTTTTHDIWTWAAKHYRIKSIKLTTDANVSSVYLYDPENARQISESIGASSSLTLTDIKNIEALQLIMTSGATAGTCVVEIYYEEIPAMIV
jgi:LEA14-like dessication related protein